MNEYDYYITYFEFADSSRKMSGQLKTLHPIDEHYPLDFYICNAIGEHATNIKFVDEKENIHQNIDLYLIDDHHLYYTYIYRNTRVLFYY